jgi:alpha-beta hydrolase superfamily lysophospholipase
MTDLDCPDDDAWRDQNGWRQGKYEVHDGGNFPVGIRRIPREGKKGDNGTVLLVHGASATSRTFMVPDGGLARHLTRAGWNVWTLDWRTSGLRAPDLIEKQVPALDFNLTNAQQDLARALEIVLGAAPAPIHLVGHCIGGALVADCLANGNQDVFGKVGNVVLTTLGLFFRAGIDDWVKGNERLLEDIWWRIAKKQKAQNEKRRAFISPWVADPAFAKKYRWPSEFERAYTLWSRSPLPHACDNEFCRRASFMFGIPYRADDMQALHDAPKPNGLWAQFGRMPLVAYMHCVQNLRRGWMAGWDADDGDLTAIQRSGRFAAGNNHVTLITGNENQVWHRDSIDRMYEWLLRVLEPAAHGRVHKHVLPRYGHQDLYWSDRASEDVYPLIEKAIRPR